MGDLGELLSSTDEQSQQDLYNTLQAQNWLMSNMGTYVLSKDDEFDTKTYTFSGLNDIYESFMLDIAGAAEIPVTKLFGRAPAGMNATGDSDLQNYYDMIGQKQTEQLQPVLDKLLPIMFISEFGSVPEDWDYSFNPVATPSENELADIVEKKTNSIVNVFVQGITSQKIALKELKQMSDSTGMFTNITDEDIENADDGTGMDDMGQSDTLNFNEPSAKLPITDGDFKESDHPRNENGQFGSKGGGSGECKGEIKVDSKTRQHYNENIIGVKVASGHVVKSVAEHAIKRAIQRKLRC